MSKDGISPGSIELIFGHNFGTVDNTSVTVGGSNAKVLAVSGNQIRALFPSNLPAGPAMLTVTVDGAVAETASVIVLAHDPEHVAFGKGSVSAGPAAEFYLPNLPETRTNPPVFAPPRLPSPSAAAATAGSGIVYTCDASITALSATACDTLNTTIAGLYSSAFTNANASIYVTLVSGGAFANSHWVYNYSSGEYSSFRNALLASETDANDTTAIADNVTAVNPYGSSSLGLITALQRALGLLLSGGPGLEADYTTSCILGTTGCYDGVITIGSGGPWYFRKGVISGNQFDFFTFVEHETDEILGTASACCGSSGIVFPADYFRYHSDGTRSFAFGTNDPCSSSDSTNACFSIDGKNMLQQYNNLNIGYDTGDWVSNCAQPLVQDYATCSGTAGVDISPAAEILVLDVIGYTLRNPSLSGAITSVTSSTPNGTYGVGASVSIAVTFSEPVTVTGTPLLALNSGGTAGYSFGSDTNTLTFIYAVGAGQNSSGLDYASTGSLTLNGGGIKGSGGAAENLTLAVPGTQGSLGSGRDIVINTSPLTDVTFSFMGTGTGTQSSFTLSGTGIMTPYGATTIFVTGGTINGITAVDFVVTYGDGSTVSASATSTLPGNTYSGTATIISGTGSFAGATGSFTFALTVNPGAAPDTYSFTESGSGTISIDYYFPQLALGGGWQMTLTYVNYSPQTVTCQTNFYTDTGGPLAVPFNQGTVSTRTDVLAPGGSIHDQTVSSLTAGVTEGWAQSSCNGGIEASLLYRYYTNGVATSEAGVNAETAPATNFATFAQTATGVAYANPSTTQSAMITFTVYNTAGAQLANTVITLGPLAHSAANLGPLLGLASFNGYVKITSTRPIISLSLNAEAFPVISSLPPGDLPSGFSGGGGTTNYYFSQLALGGGWQVTLSYVNYSPQTVTCTTNFYTDSGGPLSVPFNQGTIAARTDILPPGGSIHDQTVSSLAAGVTEGWAKSSCSGGIEASLLYRYYTNGVATSEAGVNAETATTTKFATFAQTATGISYANPSTTLTAMVTLEVYTSAGTPLGSHVIMLGPLQHGSANLGPLLGLASFTGFVKITSTNPIVSLSLNAEAFPVISSLPPGDLPAATTFVTP